MLTTTLILSQFDSSGDALDGCLEMGVSVYKTGCDVDEMQERFNYFEEQGLTGGITVSAAEVIMPKLTSLFEEFDQRSICRPQSGYILNRDIFTGSQEHTDFGGILRGVTLLVPVYHDSLFTTYSPDGKTRVHQGLYSPGEILLVRQIYNEHQATRHSNINVTRPADLNKSIKRIVISLDPSLADGV